MAKCCNIGGNTGGGGGGGGGGGEITVQQGTAHRRVYGNTITLNPLTDNAQIAATAHGLSETPIGLYAVLTCLTADLGYAVGAKIPYNESQPDRLGLWVTDTQIGGRMRGRPWIVNVGATESGTELTAASWMLEITPYYVEEVDVITEAEGEGTIHTLGNKDVGSELIGSGNVNVTSSTQWPSAANMARIEIPEGDDAPEFIIVSWGADQSSNGNVSADYHWVRISDLLGRAEGAYSTAATAGERLGFPDSSGAGTDVYLGWITDPNDATKKLILATSSAANDDILPLTVRKPVVNAVVSVEGGSGGGSGGAGGGDFHSVTGMPQPSEDISGQVYFNQHTLRAEACLNVPYFTTRATATWNSLASYYDNTGSGDEDMTVVDAFPGTGAAASTDEDDYLYAVDLDRFFFGSTAPGAGNYAWYQDSEEDALEALCNRYRTGESGTVLGATADIRFLGQMHGDNEATELLHALTVDLTATYYVYFDLDSNAFKLCNAYDASALVKEDHWQFIPIQTDQISPSVVVPGGGNNLDPNQLKLNQLKLEGGHLFYNKPIIHAAHDATYTWADYAGEGYTFTGTAAWRGTVASISALSGISTAVEGDRAFVSSGLARGFFVHNANATWSSDQAPAGYDFIGYPAALADANGIAQHHIDEGSDATTILAFYGGESNLRRLSAYTAAATASTEHRFELVRTDVGNPTAYFYGHGQTARYIGTPGNYIDDDASGIRFADPSNANAREYYNGGEAVFDDMFLAVADVPSDADTLDGSGQLTFMYWRLPAGRYNIDLALRLNGTFGARNSLALYSVASGNDNVVIPGDNDTSATVANLSDSDIVTDGTTIFYWRTFNIGTPNVGCVMKIEKVA